MNMTATDNIITIEELGGRIKDCRNYMLLTQQQVSEWTGLTVLTISKIEHGRMTTSPALFKLLGFYGNYFSLDYIFAKDFTIKEAENNTKPYSMSTVVKARLDIIRSEINTSLEKARKNIDENLRCTASLL